MLKKIKELSKETAIYGISTIVGRFLGFLLVPFYTNVFNTEEFGIYTYVYTILAFLNLVFIYGMDAAFMKYSSLAQEADKKKVFSTSFLTVSFTAIILSALIYLFKIPVTNFINLPISYSNLTVYVLGILLIDTITVVPFANLRIQRKAKKFAAIRIVNIGLNITLNLVFILYYKMGVEAIFLSNLLASLFSLLVLIPDILKNLQFVIDRSMLKKILNFGLPYLPGSLAAMVVQMIDVPIMRELTNDSTVGIYRANYKLGIFMMLFVSMFQFAWQPFFLENAKEKNAKEIFSKIFTIFLIISSCLWVILTLFIDDIASIELFNNRTIIGREYLVGLKIVPVILLGYFFYGMYINFNAGIYIQEKTKFFPLVTGIGAAANIGVNFLLIPVYGIMGAAIATLISYIVMALGLFIVSQKFYPIQYKYKKIISVLLIILIFSIIYFLSVI
jgi:O-antigen/teichoic acid export membrane protein